MCLAVYTLAGGRILRGFMVKRLNSCQITSARVSARPILQLDSQAEGAVRISKLAARLAVQRVAVQAHQRSMVDIYVTACEATGRARSLLARSGPLRSD
jgi:hypothetical protein